MGHCDSFEVEDGLDGPSRTALGFVDAATLFSPGHCRFFPHPAEEKESCFLNNLKSMLFIDYSAS